MERALLDPEMEERMLALDASLHEAEARSYCEASVERRPERPGHRTWGWKRCSRWARSGSRFCWQHQDRGK